jgi:hypothetical protein
VIGGDTNKAAPKKGEGLIIKNVRGDKDASKKFQVPWEHQC